jgi:hypothetical protein
VAGGSEIFGRLQECYHLTGDELGLQQRWIEKSVTIGNRIL